MLIRVASDLHLEAFFNEDADNLALRFIPPHESDKRAVLVLAGDISSDRWQLIEFISRVEQRFHKVIFVPGNHELYRYNYLNWSDITQSEINSKTKNTIFSRHDDVISVVVDNVRFVCGTLWGDGGLTPVDQIIVGNGLNDFRLIRFNDRIFTVADMMTEHRKQKKKIEECLLASHAGPTVVVTHHLPSRMLVDEKYRALNGTDGINGGFVGDCESLLSQPFAPAAWICGHSHTAKDHVLWNTRVVSNPAGYKGEWIRKNIPNNFPVFIKV